MTAAATTVDPAMVRRVAAAQATLDRFKDRPFRWGREDCARMTAFHLRRLGHKVKLPPTDGYRTPKAALAALRARGFENLLAAVDAHGFERIPPAAATVGDIIACPGEGPFGAALHVALGNGRTVGYHEDAVGAAVLQPIDYVAAWRIEPR